MGRPKGEIVLDGATLAQRAVRALEPLCARVLVSVAPGSPVAVAGALRVEDLPPAGRGPLAGLSAALAATDRADLLVLACDYPRVSTAFLRALLVAAGEDPVDLTLPVDSSGRTHPLVALWRGGTEVAIAAALGQGEHAVRAVVGVLHVRRLAAVDLEMSDIDPILANWNSPADLPGRTAAS
jgi:molybdopterin-guanine dinucleotide biosynthesis protein A